MPQPEARLHHGFAGCHDAVKCFDVDDTLDSLYVLVGPIDGIIVVVTADFLHNICLNYEVVKVRSVDKLTVLGRWHEL